MISFDKWCEENCEVVNGHGLKILASSNDNLTTACNLVASVVPEHYAAPKQIADMFDKLGKEKAAQFLRLKLPRSKNIRSGDLGEIMATEYIDECTEFGAPIKRLRWKDHREMAMRGDDVIAIAENEDDGSLRFLKTEVKSRASLSAGVVAEAREALEKDDGLPSPHALGFLSSRLYETGRSELADQINLAQLVDGVVPGQIEHLVFAFCGNPPRDFLKTDLESYQGPIRQNSAGLMVPAHQDFVAAVYEITGGVDDA